MRHFVSMWACGCVVRGDTGDEHGTSWVQWLDVCRGADGGGRVADGQRDRSQAQDRRQPKVIELDEDVIKGRVQKPEAFYILQHASLNYQRLDPKETFIPELVKSVKEEPF